MDLSDKLRFLTGATDEYAPIDPSRGDTAQDSEHEISIPSDGLPEELSIDRYLRLDRGKVPKRKSTIFDDFDDEDDSPRSHVPAKIKSEKLYHKLTKRMSEDMIDDFEDFLSDDTIFEGDGSDELRNGLISLGRKYARSTSTDADTAEVEKAFAGSEEKLKDIYDDITRDIVRIGQDLDQMRSVSRARNYKAISELTSSKTSLHQARISAVREMNSIKKARFDMKMKEKAASVGGDGNADISPSTIKSLFGSGRSQLMASTGGYAAVSGRKLDDASNYGMTDEEIDAKYFADDEDDDSESSRYLEYEHLDPRYELMVDDLGTPVEIRAVDRDGNVLPDYPIPSMEGLHFEINKTTGDATDDLHRTYKVVTL